MENIQNNKAKHNLAISYLHIIGMIMILLCHYLQAEKIYFLSEIFISGVPLFLLVAGYLAGKSQITSPLWLTKKVKRILVPFWIFIIIIYGIYDLFNLSEVSLFQWIFSLANMQGLNYTIWKFNFFGAVEGCGHLWYLTTLMLCYLLAFAVRKIEVPHLSYKKQVLTIVGMLFLQLGAMYIGLQLNYIFVFFLGYLLSKYPFKVSNCGFAGITVFTIAVSIGRILLRAVIDNTDLYNRFISLVSCTAIGIWIFYFVHYINEKLPSFTKKFDCAPVRFLEKISYYVYLTHYIFLRGPFALPPITDNKILYYLLVTALSIFSATILYIISEKFILKKLFTKKLKH